MASRILLLNPNSAADLTDRLLLQAAEFARADTAFLGRTARFGARHIGSRTAFAIAGHAAIDLAAAWFAEPSQAPVQAAILACFGDPGLEALREICPFPVLGLADAAIREAAMRGRFSIVTGGAAWVPMLQELADRLGVGGQLASIRTLPATGIAIGNDPDRFLEPLGEAACACVESDGAERVILGGAGLVGFAARLAPRLPFPLIDCLEVAVRQAEALADGDTTGTPSPAYATVETVGLSPALERLLAGDRGAS